VSVVGDFNNWNPTIAPMEQSANGVWSAVVPILPGRHVYAFMVDDSVLTLDPRAPKVRDPDFGTDGSLRMVGRP
jgi:1,4-alpha-glucan branching enzyme